MASESNLRFRNQWAILIHCVDDGRKLLKKEFNTILKNTIIELHADKDILVERLH